MKLAVFFRALRHPAGFVAASLYTLAVILVTARGHNPIGLLLFAAVLIFFAALLVDSYYSGTLKMYQGRGASKTESPTRYWFHLGVQTLVWIVFNCIFAIGFWVIIKK